MKDLRSINIRNHYGVTHLYHQQQTFKKKCKGREEKKKKERKKKPQVSQVFSMVEEKGNQITYIHVALNPKL